MKNLIFRVTSMVIIGLAILIRYCNNPNVNGPLWFVIGCEVFVAAVIIASIIDYRKDK